MPRITKIAWWCWRNHQNTPDSRACVVCGALRIERHANVHSSERAVVYYNPATGEHRTPARADQPIPEIYARQGFERREITNMIQYEKEAGVVQEATTFNPGNEEVPLQVPESKISPKVKEMIVEDIRAAISSGPWTGQEKLL